MHGAKGRCLALIAAFAAVVAAGPALAARCEQPCKAETAACIRTRCAGLEGEARRSCLETCRGIGGCAPIRTLAWVESEVRTDGIGSRQALRIRRGNCAPVTVMDLPLPTAPGALSSYGPLIEFYGNSRFGHFSCVAAFFERLSVMPDGSGVVFEVTDDVAFYPFFRLPPGVEEGFYFVRADGTGSRRLGPASGVARFRVFPDPNVPGGFASGGWVVPSTDISPNGRKFVFTDWGPGPAGERAVQIVTLDIETGERRVLTRLPNAPPPEVSGTNDPDPGYPRFVDNDTILFATTIDPPGLEPGGPFNNGFLVETDGTRLRRIGTPIPSPDAQALPSFVVTGIDKNLFNFFLVLPSPGVRGQREVFVVDGTRLLQLTNFGLPDTGRVILGGGGRRAFLRASADPFGINPSGNCQLFSVDTLGGQLQQLTRFREGARATTGCNFGPPPAGCNVHDGAQDPHTGEVVFYSSCDPFGTNPYGGQLFAMRPDGLKLRQLTSTRGRTVESDGVVSVHLPGPWAYSARTR